MAGNRPLREAIVIDGPAGRVEALVDAPREAGQRMAAVICHPHPRYHGTMMSKVVHTLARSMNDLGVPAVRFNFRGVGASEGEYAGGVGEVDDAIAVVEWARERYAGAGICLAGFSFGGMIAVRAAVTVDPAQLVTVAPAVAMLGGLASGGQPDCPWLIVQGAADEVVSCDQVVAWVNELAPGPELVVLPDVGHFFHGDLTILRETVVSHLEASWAAA